MFFKDVISKLINIQLKKHMIEKENVDLIEYGYWLLFEIIFNLFFSLLIGLLFRDVKNVVLFMLLYIPLRTYSGGWHANKMWICMIISNVVIAAEELILKYMIHSVVVWWYLPILFVFIIITVRKSPIDTDAKVLTDKEKIVYKGIIKKIVIIHSLILCICIMLQNRQGTLLFEYVYTIQVIMLLAEIM